MEQIQHDIQTRLSGLDPDIEVLLVERAGDTLRIFIDHPAGVTLAMCETVTLELAELRERYALEVSSPGPKRPLTKPEHFQRFVGRRARVRTAPHSTLGEERSLVGELIGASAQEVTLAAPEGVVAIPYAAIQRSHLVEE
jgi:ribosome maturation factor RimP